MVVSSRAVREFEDRPRIDTTRVLKASDRSLDRKIEELGLVCPVPLRRGQKVCLLLCWMRRSHLVLMGMGGGKTLLSLTVYHNRKLRKQISGALVLVPNVANLSSWEMEVRKHMPFLSVQVVDGHGADARWAQVESGADITVITYQGLRLLCSRPKKQGKRGWRLSPKGCRRIHKRFGMLVMDESTAYKNPTSLTFRVIRNLCNNIKYRYGLTGTPFDKRPEDLWSQFFSIDHGYTLGDTLGLFRASFCKEVDSGWAVKYKFKARNAKRLSRYLRHSSIRIAQEDCQDLPPQVGGLGGDDYMLRRAYVSRACEKIRNSIMSELREARGDRKQAENSYLRLRTFSSGWVKAPDGETIVRFPTNPKLDDTVDLLHEIDPSDKVIVVHWYNNSGKILAERFRKEGMSLCQISGAVSDKVKRKSLKDFLDPKGPRVLVASTAISKGVNLQDVCRYMVFYESPDIGIERLQIEARILREGSMPGARFYYDMILGGTVDLDILTSLKTGKSVVDLIVDGKVTSAF